MEGTKTFAEFAAEIQRRENEKADFLLPTPRLRMEGDESLTFTPEGKSGLFTTENAVGNPIFPIADNHVHSQIASRLSIPKTFYDGLPERAPGLRSQIVNRLFTDQPERRMVRTLDGQARAFLSDRFKPFDNILALNAVTPVLQQFPDLQIKSSDLSARRMYLQVSFPKLVGEIRKGDPVQLGLTITNSEIGLGTVNVETWLLRLVCTNGAVAQSILSKRHTGSRIEASDSDYSVYQGDTLLAEMNSLRLRLRDLTAAALTDEAFQKHLDGMRRLAGIEVTRPETVIENVTKRFQLAESLIPALQENYFTGKDYTAFGVMNAVTALTHRPGMSLDTQYDIERIGGDIIALSPKDWEVLAEKVA